MHLGDFNASATVYCPFNTFNAATTAMITLSGGTVSVYKNASTTQTTTGVTLTTDFDGVTGLHLVTIDTSADGTFYATGSEFHIVLTAGTVNGTSKAGWVLGGFSIRNRSALRPTTAGRDLDVSAGGEAGVDWANVGSPTTTLNLSGTTVAAVSGAVGSVTGAVGSVTGNVGGNVVGTVGTVNALAAGSITAAAIATGAIDADAIAADAANEIADALLDRSNGVETGVTPRQALQRIGATAAGKVSGAATTTNIFTGMDGSTVRVTATVDSDGNRTAITYA